jgi:hypothetical protein
MYEKFRHPIGTTIIICMIFGDIALDVIHLHVIKETKGRLWAASFHTQLLPHGNDGSTAVFISVSVTTCNLALVPPRASCVRGAHRPSVGRSVPHESSPRSRTTDLQWRTAAPQTVGANTCMERTLLFTFAGANQFLSLVSKCEGNHSASFSYWVNPLPFA